MVINWRDHLAGFSLDQGLDDLQSLLISTKEHKPANTYPHNSWLNASEEYAQLRLQSCGRHNGAVHCCSGYHLRMLLERFASQSSHRIQNTTVFNTMGVNAEHETRFDDVERGGDSSCNAPGDRSTERRLVRLYPSLGEECVGQGFLRRRKK